MAASLSTSEHVFWSYEMPQFNTTPPPLGLYIAHDVLLDFSAEWEQKEFIKLHYNTVNGSVSKARVVVDKKTRSITVQTLAPQKNILSVQYNQMEKDSFITAHRDENSLEFQLSFTPSNPCLKVEAGNHMAHISLGDEKNTTHEADIDFLALAFRQTATQGFPQKNQKNPEPLTCRQQ